MDGFSSQTANGFEDKIRKMLSTDKPNVRLPPAPHQPQHPPAVPPQFNGHPRGDSGANSPIHTQLQSPPPGIPTSGPSPQPSQFVPPHVRYQNSRNAAPSQPAPPVPQNHGHFPHRPPQPIQHHPQGQYPPQPYPRGPAPPQHNGQYQRVYYSAPPPPGGPFRQQQNHQSLDPDTFSRGGVGRNNGRPILFDPNARPRPQPAYNWNDARQRQAQYLEQIVTAQVPTVDMTPEERDEKDAFRQTLQALCDQVCQKHSNIPKVQLECFGSFASGFASAGSDMDLVIVVQNAESSSAVFSLLENDLPRVLEDALLRAGYGARLLTRTRVPIIKVCQSPGTSFLDKLREEREKWDFLPNEKKYPHLFQGGDEDAEDDPAHANGNANTAQATTVSMEKSEDGTKTTTVASTTVTGDAAPSEGGPDDIKEKPQIVTETTVTSHTTDSQHETQKRDQVKTWTRERKVGPLDFPKDGIGIQCDINFFNPLGLHNTQMLRCYSLCDNRVRPIVLLVKAWAKLRRINSSYSGTLSSYGYVLMVLHYLMNIVQPPVIPNLQMSWRPNAHCTPQGASKTEVDGWMVDFWRNEDEIQAALRNGQMSQNQESIGSLLAGFFQYYSSMGNGPQFRWVQHVLSLRLPGGIQTKEEKGWTKATTEEGEGKKIQHRYLFCIEDPFELTHNVARTVTHNGIVAIRDEFRRAQRILHAVGQGRTIPDGDLFSKLVETEDFINATAQLKLQGQQAPPGATRQQPPQRPPMQQAARPQANGHPPNGMRKPAPKQPAKQIDLADQDAFPTLGAAANKKQVKGNREKGNSSSIGGDEAQAYLAEYRRKKAEAQGEETANSAVEFLGL